MNIIQRAWLIALKPVSTFVNDKLAKKSGLLGKFGRFFAFGPRQFGYHPSSRFIAWANHFIVDSMGFALHRYSVWKNITGNGFFTMRPAMLFAFFGPIMVFYSMIHFALPQNAQVQEGTSLDYVKSKLRFAPVNALNDRVSAHFTQINNYYGHQMVKKYMDVVQKIKTERRYFDQKTKKTKYAVSSYKYIQPHTAVDGK